MQRPSGERVADGALVLLTLLFAVICIAFARQPDLASFADDSVSYLVMGQVFSPWSAPSAPVAAAFAQEASYPPLFPLVLGIAGAANDVARAHIATALLLAACLPLAYLLGCRWLQNRWMALAAIAITAALPALWLNVKGILSEPLYCLSLLALLLALESRSRRALAWLALAMAALVLTRTAGLALVAAYALWACTRADRAFAARLQAALPAFLAFAAYGAWLLLRPEQVPDENARVLSARLHAYFSDPGSWNGLFAGVLRQASAIAQGWVGSLLLYWVEGRPLRVLLASLVGCLALAGLFLRVRAGRADAWIMAAYLATYLLWPFYDQMGRFLFPALPVLVLYAFHAAAEAARRLGRPPALGQALTALLAASLSLPALAFVRQRADAPAPYPEMTDWYRTPDLREAKARSDVHLDLLEDMKTITSLTRPGDRVAWVKPAYIALLAGREGVRSPSAALDSVAYRRALRASGADYVFLSVYHPRDTLSDAAWQAGVRALYGKAKLVHLGTRRDSNLVASMLFEVK